MMKSYKNILLGLGLAATAMVGCREVENVPTPISGSADFSNYIAVGNSLTSGYADGGLYAESQQNSYPLMIAQQMQAVGGGEFTQPTIPGNGSGYMKLTGLVGGSPVFENVAPDPAFAQPLADGPVFNNMGVPGIRVVDVQAPGYGSDPVKTNPFFYRMLPDANRMDSYIATLAKTNPSFFTLWLGNNDILGYAADGGKSGSAFNPINTASLTSREAFLPNYQALLNTMTANDAKGVAVSIPNVLDAPYFTTVNPQVQALLAVDSIAQRVTFDAATAVQANLLYAMGGFNGANFEAGLNFPLIQLEDSTSTTVRKFDIDTDDALLTFSRIQSDVLAKGLGYLDLTSPGLVQLFTDVALVQAGQKQPNAIITLLGVGTISEALIVPVQQYVEAKNAGDDATAGAIAAQVKAATGGQLDLDMVYPAAKNEFDNEYGIKVSPIGTEYVLDQDEKALVVERTTELNTEIKTLVDANPNVAYLDIQPILDRVIKGYAVDGVTLTGAYITGGAFSTDGIHLTPRGYAVTANGIIDAINKDFGSTISPVQVGNYRAVELP
ncbi:hypothetical protein [Persicobacter psychrovividus]|uniref:Outer membrane protein n=1 Tax=Persicobacter psychrovividus TaxID=387638 RepID=A0ABM7VEZ2_9BACT|nr:outer membrane protein [Persicobacter psychrovividus]